MEHSNKVLLKDWCRFSGTGASYIDPGSPWQNPYVESFGSRVRDARTTTRTDPTQRSA
jgi:Integrase core domain